jgi:hypothetical protein
MTTYRYGSCGMVLLAALAAGPAWAGAPGPETRAANLPRVCSRGGNTCTDDADCTKGKCVPDYERTGFNGILTLVADDNVTRWDGGASVDDVHAVTVLLELRIRGVGRQVLAQTYQALDGANFADLTAALQEAPFLADTEGSATPTNEEALAGAQLDDFDFQQPDVEMSDALRQLFSSMGTPVVREGSVKLLDVTDHRGDSLGTVARFKVKGRFVAP